MELIERNSQPVMPAIDTTKGKYVYGRAGLAELLGCSKTTVSRIKQSGIIDGAITQWGNQIIVDAEKAISLIKEHEEQKANKK